MTKIGNFLQPYKKVTQVVSLYFLLLFTLIGFSGVIRTLRYELSQPYTADSPIYWAVGRGILNQRIPYQDLFETKPPAMFLVSAASFFITGDTSLTHFAQFLVLLLFPFFGIYAALKVTKPHQKSRLFLSIIGFLFGSLLMQYTQWNAGEFQTESFGAAFAIIYGLIIMNGKKNLNTIELFLASLSMMCSIGFKEPFLLIIFSSALLHTNHWQEFKEKFITPTILSLLSGTFFLVLIGWFKPYSNIYLYEEMFHRTQMDSSAFMRGLNIIKVTTNLSYFNKGLLMIIICLLLILTVLSQLRKLEKKYILKKSGVLFLIIYLTTFTVGLGSQYYNHHYVFAVPIYFSFFLIFIQYISQHWKIKLVRISSIVFAYIVSLALYLSPQQHQDFDQKIESMRDLEHSGMVTAQTIDTILINCKKDSYLFLGPNGPFPYAYTQHSPQGPLFFQLDTMFEKNKFYFKNKFLDSLHQAQFVVLHSYQVGDLRSKTKKYIQDNFTSEPWECAKPSTNHPNYVFLYRKSDFETSKQLVQ